MDIGFAADRRRVAQRLGDRLQHVFQADPVLPGGADLLEGDPAGSPGAEMLGGELLAHRFADIGVDVARADRALIALLVDELEALLAGPVLAALDEAGPVSTRDGKPLTFSGLALETPFDRTSLHR